ncbi:MAG: T9SS type A sorting domain-containing protein [Flavobacteriales bacterium]
MKKSIYLCVVFVLSLMVQAHAGTWIEKANFGGDARHRAVAFSIGNRGYMGLGHVNSIVDILFNDIWEYDPGSNSWTQKANFGGGLRYHATAFVIGNFAYVGTGRSPSGVLNTDFWKFDPVLNIWTPVASFIGSARRGAVSFTIDGKGYTGTGNYTADFYQYDPILNSWSPIAALPGSPRTSSVAFSIGDKGYLGTGDVGGGINDFYEYNPTTNVWTPKAPVGPVLRQEATGFSINGMGFIGTGDDFSSGNNYGDMWMYNPTLNTWTQVEDFGGLARRYLVSFTIGNKAYSGTGTNGTNFKDFWVYDYWLSALEREKELVRINAYPNPAVDVVTISLENIPADLSANSLMFEMYDMNGKCVASRKISQSSFTVNRPLNGSGVYIYSVQYENQAVRRGKIIFQ